MQIMRTHKRICKDFGQSNTLLLADVLGNFRNICLEIDKINPEKSFSAPGLACQATLKALK